ncbi:MAG: segregation/condensation protein A [Alphaproteobacteria bacterium]|nr:MAG: segregation/condensation protein A [Alphaproteobacteria bacterium]
MTTTLNPSFEADVHPPQASNENTGGEGLRVDLGGYEGPLDVLLNLARDQKIDLAQINIVALADQYLSFIHLAKKQNLEIAADYLVMAAWLTYLKSRLLLPDPPPEDEPTPEELSAALQWQLQRLASMQKAGAQLMSKSRLGIDVFRRAEPEGIPVVHNSEYDVSLYDLLSAYGDFKQRITAAKTFTINPDLLETIERAMGRLRQRMGLSQHWESLISYLPTELLPGVVGRSFIASTFAASLELTKSGEAQLRQLQNFGPLYIRKKSETA